MILDKNLVMCDGTDATHAAGTVFIGSAIDLGSAFAANSEIYLVIDITESFVGATATVRFGLATDGTSTISTSTATELLWTPDYPVATLVAGTRLFYELPKAVGDFYERYMGILCKTTTATTTAGKISAYLTLDAQNWSPLPKAIS